LKFMKRIISGILSIGSSLGVMGSMISALWLESEGAAMEETAGMIALVVVILGIALISVVTTLVLMVVYMIHAAKNKRDGWAVSLCVFNIFVIPFYWYRYIRSEDRPRQTN